MNGIFERKLKQTLLKEVHKKEIVVLTGMRQVGKTTLMQDIFLSVSTPNKLMLDLENPINRIFFEENDFENIIKKIELAFPVDFKKDTYVFLDEVQLAPSAIRAVKYLYDHHPIKFFLTGSSSFYLKNLFPESLSGRKVVYELFPLDFEEFLLFKRIPRKFDGSLPLKAENKNIFNYEKFKIYFEEYMNFGGFPSVVLEDEKGRKMLLLENIVKSYFEKDVRALSDFRNLNKFRDIILLLSGRTGSKIDISKISIELSLSRDSVYDYLNFLEHTYFVHLIKPFSRNVDGEVKGARKIYFCDTGILNYLNKTALGSIFENSVFNLLRKYGKLNYYQKYNGPEIDFIINEKIACEVKTFATASHIQKVKLLSEQLKLDDFFIITQKFSKEAKAIFASDL